MIAIPRSRTAKGRPIYDSWIEKYSEYCTNLATIPHSDTPLHKQDVWWNIGPIASRNGAQEMQTSKWDL